MTPKIHVSCGPTLIEILGSRDIARDHFPDQKNAELWTGCGHTPQMMEKNGNHSHSLINAAIFDHFGQKTAKNAVKVCKRLFAYMAADHTLGVLPFLGLRVPNFESSCVQRGSKQPQKAPNLAPFLGYPPQTYRLNCVL
jgi:hypothetical protein